MECFASGGVVGHARFQSLDGKMYLPQHDEAEARLAKSVRVDTVKKMHYLVKRHVRSE